MHITMYVKTENYSALPRSYIHDIMDIQYCLLLAECLQSIMIIVSKLLSQSVAIII
jgi:hypothetical protein